MGKLELESLKKGMPGMEPALGEGCAHAASVCLEHQRHRSDRTQLTVDGSRHVIYDLTWAPATDQTRRSWADLQEATEAGATGIAALLVQDLRGYEILQRSWKGTGFDYWIGAPGTQDLMFQNKARLEVTGILKGTEGEISTRLKQKLNRFAEHPHDSPAMVVVVEFGTPRSRIAE